MPAPRPPPPGPHPRPARNRRRPGQRRRRSAPTRSARRPRRRPYPSDLAAALARGPFLDELPAVLRDLVLPGHPPDLDLGPGDRRDPLGPLDRLLFRGDIEQEEAPEEFLGLSVRPVRDHRGLAAEVDHDALARIVQPFGREENAALHHLLDEEAG